MEAESVRSFSRCRFLIVAAVVFNGVIERYADHPIQIKVDNPVRIFFVNAGPNRTSSFHVVGTVFSSVYRSGNPANVEHDVQTFEVGPGNGAVFEFTVA